MDNFELKSFLGSFNSVRSGARISRIIKSIVESLFAGLKKTRKHLIFLFTFLCFKSVLKKNVMEYNHTMHASLTLLNHIEFEKRNSVLFNISLNQAWLH